MHDKKITVSVVSHGHGALVMELLQKLKELREPSLCKLVITINDLSLDGKLVQDLERSQQELHGSAHLSFELVWLVNRAPSGFSSNHNNAFEYCASEYFLVLNPDISFTNNPFPLLVSCMNVKDIAMTYPTQTDSRGRPLDYEREMVTPGSLLQRYITKLLPGLQHNTWHTESGAQTRSDWVSGSFMLFKSEAFKHLNGFDKGYFMYCEDVDICFRLQLAGYTFARADAVVVHDTQRRTLKNKQHLAWHVRSLMRLWNSRAYNDFKKLNKKEL